MFSHTKNMSLSLPPPTRYCPLSPLLHNWIFWKSCLHSLSLVFSSTHSPYLFHLSSALATCRNCSSQSQKWLAFLLLNHWNLSLFELSTLLLTVDHPLLILNITLFPFHLADIEISDSFVEYWNVCISQGSVLDCLLVSIFTLSVFQYLPHFLLWF